jgi:hypothetical protein
MLELDHGGPSLQSTRLTEPRSQPRSLLAAPATLEQAHPAADPGEGPAEEKLPVVPEKARTKWPTQIWSLQSLHWETL